MQLPHLNPLSYPVYVMSKPAGAACNLRCDYCYYLEKASRRDASTGRAASQVMSDAVLEDFIKQYIAMQTTDTVMFTWHGGEPMLRGLDFYKRVVALQQRYADGRHIDNALQTNGTLLTPEWCRFLRDEQWLVGISIDGPEDLHNAYRKGPHSGSWQLVMRGISLLRQYDVEWNAMATVNHLTADSPEAFYRFFRDELQCRFLQFTPVVERRDRNGRLATVQGGGDIAPWSVTPEQWGRFLCAVFDQWVWRDVGEVFVQIFDATLAGWMGVVPGVCTLAEKCGHAAVIEADGTVYSCDHFVFPEYRLGHVSEGLMRLLYSEAQQRFGRNKHDALPQQCRQCQWLFACHGECPRLRFSTTADGEPGLNYLCEGYRRYFEHVAAAMDFMRQELLNNRPPSGVMQWLAGPRQW